MDVSCIHARAHQTLGDLCMRADLFVPDTRSMVPGDFLYSMLRWLRVCLLTYAPPLPRRAWFASFRWTKRCCTVPGTPRIRVWLWARATLCMFTTTTKRSRHDGAQDQESGCQSPHVGMTSCYSGVQGRGSDFFLSKFQVGLTPEEKKAEKGEGLKEDGLSGNSTGASNDAYACEWGYVHLATQECRG